MKFTTLTLTRATALTVGAAAAGVGCYASYEAAAKADGGYLMVAAPIVALAAAIIPCFWERAIHDRQWIRAFALFAVWLPCVATVFFTAVERVHFAKAGGEAQRSALHTVVDRAKAQLSDANAALVAATTAANKVRGLEGKTCRTLCLSAKATEASAARHVADAEAALAAAESKAVAEASIKQPEWLLPLALEVAGMILIAAGFGLGRKSAPVAPELTKRQIAARKGVETKQKKKRLRIKARQTGPRLAVSR